MPTMAEGLTYNDLVSIAKKMASSGEFSLAIATYKSALAKQDSLTTRVELADTYLKKGDMKEAVSNYLLSIQHLEFDDQPDASKSSIWKKLAEAYKKNNQASLASSALQKAESYSDISDYHLPSPFDRDNSEPSIPKPKIVFKSEDSTAPAPAPMRASQMRNRKGAAITTRPSVPSPTPAPTPSPLPFNMPNPFAAKPDNYVSRSKPVLPAAVSVGKVGAPSAPAPRISSTSGQSKNNQFSFAVKPVVPRRDNETRSTSSSGQKQKASIKTTYSLKRINPDGTPTVSHSDTKFSLTFNGPMIKIGNYLATTAYDDSLRTGGVYFFYPDSLKEAKHLRIELDSAIRGPLNKVSWGKYAEKGFFIDLDDNFYIVDAGKIIKKITHINVKAPEKLPKPGIYSGLPYPRAVRSLGTIGSSFYKCPIQINESLFTTGNGLKQVAFINTDNSTVKLCQLEDNGKVSYKAYGRDDYISEQFGVIGKPVLVGKNVIYASLDGYLYKWTGDGFDKLRVSESLTGLIRLSRNQIAVVTGDGSILSFSKNLSPGSLHVQNNFRRFRCHEVKKEGDYLVVSGSEGLRRDDDKEELVLFVNTKTGVKKIDRRYRTPYSCLPFRSDNGELLFAVFNGDGTGDIFDSSFENKGYFDIGESVYDCKPTRVGSLITIPTLANKISCLQFHKEQIDLSKIPNRREFDLVRVQSEPTGNLIGRAVEVTVNQDGFNRKALAMISQKGSIHYFDINSLKEYTDLRLAIEKDSKFDIEHPLLKITNGIYKGCTVSITTKGDVCVVDNGKLLLKIAGKLPKSHLYLIHKYSMPAEYDSNVIVAGNAINQLVFINLETKSVKIVQLGAKSKINKNNIEVANDVRGKPYVSGELVYAGSSDGFLYKVKPSGVVQKKKVGEPIYTTVVPVGETAIVVATCDGQICSFNKADLVLRKKYNSPGFIFYPHEFRRHGDYLIVSAVRRREEDRQHIQYSLRIYGLKKPTLFTRTDVRNSCECTHFRINSQDFFIFIIQCGKGLVLDHNLYIRGSFDLGEDIPLTGCSASMIGNKLIVPTRHNLAIFRFKNPAVKVESSL